MQSARQSAAPFDVHARQPVPLQERQAQPDKHPRSGGCAAALPAAKRAKAGRPAVTSAAGPKPKPPPLQPQRNHLPAAADRRHCCAAEKQPSTGEKQPSTGEKPSTAVKPFTAVKASTAEKQPSTAPKQRPASSHQPVKRSRIAGAAPALAAARSQAAQPVRDQELRKQQLPPLKLPSVPGEPSSHHCQGAFKARVRCFLFCWTAK